MTQIYFGCFFLKVFDVLFGGSNRRSDWLLKSHMIIRLWFSIPFLCFVEVLSTTSSPSFLHIDLSSRKYTLSCLHIYYVYVIISQTLMMWVTFFTSFAPFIQSSFSSFLLLLLLLLLPIGIVSISINSISPSVLGPSLYLSFITFFFLRATLPVV